MYAAEVEKDYVQVNGGFQVFQRLAETKTEPRETAQMCPHGQVGAFDVTCRDAARIGVPGDWDRDCSFYVRGAIPVRGFAVRSAVEFEKLGKVNVGSEVILNGRDIASHSVRRDLETSSNPLTQVADKGIGGHSISFCVLCLKKKNYMQY